jgi:uncharacterized protein with PIN domain
MMVAPANAGDALQLLAERLHDDFLRVVDLVHDEAELAAVGLQHDDADTSARAVRRFAERAELLGSR